MRIMSSTVALNQKISFNPDSTSGHPDYEANTERRFGPNPSNAPRNGFARLKHITHGAVKTKSIESL
jgi:hypothetical protein